MLEGYKTNATLRDDCTSLQADLLSELDPDSNTDTASEDNSAEPSHYRKL